MYDANGDKLSPTACNKQGKIYRYYTSLRLMRTKLRDPDGWRLPADHIETVVIGNLRAFLEDQNWLLNKLAGGVTDPILIKRLIDQASWLSGQLQSLPAGDKKALLHSIIKRIDFETGTMSIILHYQKMYIALGLEDDFSKFSRDADAKTIQLYFPMQLKRRGVETRLIVGGETETFNHDPKLIQIIAQAHVWSQQLTSGTAKSVCDIAMKEKLEAGEISRVLPLAYLAPDIVSAILNGNQPVDLTADHLKRHASKLPASWQQQKQILRFTA